MLGNEPAPAPAAAPAGTKEKQTAADAENKETKA